MEQQMSESQTLSYAPPPTPVNTRGDVARRATLWTVLCSVCALPSFLFAAPRFNVPAMVVGVVLFIILYTFATSTPAFLRFREKPFVRRTLYIGYVTRVVISIIFPLGMIVDFFPGLISVTTIAVFVDNPRAGPGLGSAMDFFGTLLTTILQGTLVNAVLGIYMAVVWGFQRIFLKLPEDRYGFPVEINSASKN
jgi:hypothetical protein